MIRVVISEPSPVGDWSDAPVGEYSLSEVLHANAGDLGLIDTLRRAWKRRERHTGRRIASARIGGGASPRLFITLHRFDLPTPTR